MSSPSPTTSMPPSDMQPTKKEDESSISYVRWIFIFILILILFGGMYMFFKFYMTPKSGNLRNNGTRINNRPR